MTLVRIVPATAVMFIAGLAFAQGPGSSQPGSPSQPGTPSQPGSPSQPGMPSQDKGPSGPKEATPQKAPDRTPDKSGSRDLPGDPKKSQKEAVPKDPPPAKDKSASPQKGDRDPSGQKGAPGTKKEAAQPGPRLTEDQRTKVKSVFAKRRQDAPRANVTVNVSVGVRVPRTVQLAAIPQDILVIVPEYRRYRYFVVDNRICVVDPDTLVIVDVIVIAA